MLLYDSYHPDMLRDALDRDLLFARLWNGIEKNPRIARVMLFEQLDLENGDIPVFSSRPGSRDLWTSRNERIVEFFDETSLSHTRRCLQTLSDDDLSKQTWIIRASMSAYALDFVEKEVAKQDADIWSNINSSNETTSMKGDKRPAAPNSDQLLAAARTVANRLDWLSLRDQSEIAWLGVNLINDRMWKLLPLGFDLYNGTAGIVLFMAYLGAITGKDRYTALAKTSLRCIQRQLQIIMKTAPTFDVGIGAFSGLGGIIYVMTHAGILWNEREWLAEAEALAEQLPKLIELDENFDFIGGSAGCIPALLGLYQATSAKSLLASAIQCGEHLINRAQSMTKGIAWQTKIKATKPLAGLSHGASGIALSLLELAAQTGETRFRESALDAMRYERSIFVPELGNWPDLRDISLASTLKQDDSKPYGFMVTWCHGAPGIGLARLHSLVYHDDIETRDEIAIALNTTLKQGFGLNHCLCHGDLGNLELLLQASQILPDSKWHVSVAEITTRILDNINQKGWICGIPMGIETPGLMTGLAGIGYGLLRLAEPERVPSVLLLAPPISRQ